METHVDANNPMQVAVATRLVPSGDEAAPARAARWRRRGAALDTHEHIELPLVGDPEPQHAPRDAELWLLARRSQGAALRVELELRTAFVRQVFRRDFVYVSRQLHGLETSRRVQGLDRSALNEALAALQQRADDVQSLLRCIAVDLDAAIAAQAAAGARITFARPARFQATIVSPCARRYLALLSEADDTLARLEMAWLLGAVDPARRSALLSDCRRALHGFKELASQRRQVVGDLVREVNAQRRHEAAIAPHGGDG